LESPKCDTSWPGSTEIPMKMTTRTGRNLPWKEKKK
jgi:hypothetical protein